MLIDTHAHLTSRRFAGQIDDVIRRAAENAVEKIVSIACDLDDSREVIDLAKKHGSVYPTVGIHPCYVHEIAADDWVYRLQQLAKSHPVAGIGEIGLDYFHSPPEGYTEQEWRIRQTEVFVKQLELARSMDLPVVIHQRESGEDVLSILRDFPEVTAVLHCFTGTMAQAEVSLGMGHYLSFTGVVTYPKAPEVREVAAMVPPDRFMVETDSPYLAPVPFRGKSNEPGYVVHTAAKIAEVRGISEEECANLSTANAHRFFRNLEKPR